MPSRDAIPLHRNRQRVLIEHLDPRENNVNQHKGMATHLMLGSGIRNDTCGHCHKSWFHYQGDELYLQVPPDDKCRKDTDGVCGECDAADKPSPFYPKTPAGGGRKIHIGNHYYDHSTHQVRYFGLRDRVESYFAISPPGSDEPAMGFDMIQANGSDGVSPGPLSGWVRDVCVAAGISKSERENRLKQGLKPNKEENDEGDEITTKYVTEMIADNGTDNQGQPIPDVFAHDLRATYCTQLCRVESPNYSEILAKTGHKNEKTLYRYVGFAGEEIDPESDKTLF